ncbi:hypothetical protein [Streptomyces sp. NPDC056069]|uniref:hypothetical protein n=1 Tax=Streptomyces sp. NPDC056069 TaxID=3345702 RepID=UPI0035DFBA6A
MRINAESYVGRTLPAVYSINNASGVSAPARNIALDVSDKCTIISEAISETGNNFPLAGVELLQSGDFTHDVSAFLR